MRYFQIIALFISLSAFCQEQLSLDYYLPQDVGYNENIPKPKSIIGYEIGEWHVSHDKLVQYMYALAESSDRIRVENRGVTFEGKPLLLVTATSKANQSNLESIQNDHIAATNGEITNFENRPTVVYQGYTIHGNEPSGSNAALVLAYYLAAAESPSIDDLLKNTVILIDPCMNPDGADRFAYWVNTNRSMNLNPDPNDREFSEVWPGGRTNHYWFDMNRDWLPAQMPESKVRVSTFHQWLPNILTDHHEMGTNSTYFFQPGIPSRTHPLTPNKNQEITKTIAQFHAKALDKIGSLYYSEESFDDFYYGKGSSFPDINGSIGILFEQGSSRGHLQESVNGLLSFPFTIRNQFTTSLSTLEAAKQLRTELLEYQYNFFKNAKAEANKTGNKAIVFGDEKDAARTYHLAEILDRHQIKFHEIKQKTTINGKTYMPGYSYVVPRNQKNARLINGMFEKRTSFQDSLFYDVSAWTLPLAFNLDYAETTTSVAGNEVTELKKASNSVSSKSNYAYLMEWHEYYAPKAIYTILNKGLRAKVSLKQFKSGGTAFDYGTILIPVQNQKLDADEIFKLLNSIAQETGVTIKPVDTGLNEGIDLGSNNFRPLELPKVAILVGNGVRSYDAGEIWHLLDTRYQMPITKIDVKNFNRADLSRYNTIIMVNHNSALNEEQSKKLKGWVSEGGTLVAYRNALRWLKTKEYWKPEFMTTRLTAKDVSFEERGDFRGAQFIGGAIFEANIDRSHPINFGYKNSSLALFRNTNLFMKPEADSYNNPIQYTKTPLLS
ncbi:MAG: M14 metallopeptidase family protein [Bacteroidota bacterium]